MSSAACRRLLRSSSLCHSRRCGVEPSSALLMVLLVPAVVDCFSALPCEVFHRSTVRRCPSTDRLLLMVHRGAARTQSTDSNTNVPLQDKLIERRKENPTPSRNHAIPDDVFSDLLDVGGQSEDSDSEVDYPEKHIEGLRYNWEAWMNTNFPNVVSAMEDLTHKSASVRKAAVSQLLKSAGPLNSIHGDHHARAITNALAGRLADDSASVREAAVKGLSCINGKGNRNLVLAMAELAEEETAVTVRRAAIQALTRIADRGDEEALAPVLRVLHRVEGHERGDHFTPHLSAKLSRHAVRAVGSLADRRDSAALKALCARVADDADSSVREAAARSLGSVADVRDRCAIAALALGLEDRDEAVRRAALRSLRAIIRASETDCDQSCASATDEPWRASRLWLLSEVGEG